MFKVFKAFVQKELYHILRDKRTLLILFGMPVAQVFIFGFAVTNEFKDAYLDIYDQAMDDTSKELVQHLRSSGHFSVNNFIHSDKELEDGFKKGTTKLAVVIPNDFSSELAMGNSTTVQLLADGSDPNNANTLVQYASTMIASCGLYNILV
ncbi:MAG: ABC transporter permease [Bacteroidota bacterium]